MNVVAPFILIPLLFLFTSCREPDVFICWDLNADKVGCNRTITDQPIIVDDFDHPYIDADGNKISRSQLKKQSLILPLDSWKEIKTYILDQCKKHGDCKNVETRINQFESQL